MISSFNTINENNNQINGSKHVYPKQQSMLNSGPGSKHGKIQQGNGLISDYSNHTNFNSIENKDTSSNKISLDYDIHNKKVDLDTKSTTSVKIINQNQDFYLFKQSSKRSKKGCLTCKCRKKKCSEEKPICSDCKRLSKKCIWIDENMDEEEIRKLKEKVELEESNHKMRKRKSKKQDASDVRKNNKKQDLHIGHNVLEKLPDIFPTKILDSEFSSTGLNTMPSSTNSNALTLDQVRNQALNLPSHLLNNYEPKPRPLDYSYDPLASNINQLQNDITHTNDNVIHDDGLKLTQSTVNLLNNPSTNDLLSSSFNFNTPSHNFDINLNESNIRFTKNFNHPDNGLNPLMEPKSAAPESPDPLKSFKYYQQPSPNSPTISNLMNPVDDNKQGQSIPKQFNLDDTQSTQLESLVELIDNKSGFESNKTPHSPSAFLSFLMDLKHYEPKLQLLDDETHDQKNSKNQVVLRDQHTVLSNFSSLSPSNYEHITDEIQNIMTPLPFWEPSYIPVLSSSTANYLYNYYEHTLSKHVSISPKSQNESNSYQKVFLPLAHKDPGVLYAILGWAGHHLGGDWIKEGIKYSKLAVNHLSKSMFGIDDYNKSPLRLKATKSSTLRNDREDTNSIIIKMATLLILCGSEICKGDVSNWSAYLSWCWKILSENGGIFKFNTSKESHWLISNFAYHDLLSSSSNERGTYFPSEQYDLIFKDKEGYSRGNLNPLLGVSKELIKIIGDISTLVYDSKNQLDQYYNRDQSPFELHSLSSSPRSVNGQDANDDDDDDDDALTDLSDHGKISRLLLAVIKKSKDIEHKIETCRPDPKDLAGLTDEELELQLTLFEAIQIAAKLFLRQSIMKCNPSMLECQVLNNDLIKCIDILVGSPVQASLVFPIFMAGVHSVTKHDRDLMTLRMENFIKVYGPWNLARAKYLMEKVWERNIEGNSVVDWYSILKELGWDINFA